MKSLYQKVQRVESLQKKADEQSALFKKHAHIDCLEFCADCCRYNDIEATPIEFLPLAWHAYKLGFIDEWLEKLCNNNSKQCIFSAFEDGRWGCKVYPVRGMICRLFGFSAVKDKNGKHVLAVCHTIKEKSPNMAVKASEYAKKGGKIPVLEEFYSQLSDIDFTLANEYFPINEAIKQALIIVQNHVYYANAA